MNKKQDVKKLIEQIYNLAPNNPDYAMMSLAEIAYTSSDYDRGYNQAKKDSISLIISFLQALKESEE